MRRWILAFLILFAPCVANAGSWVNCKDNTTSSALVLTPKSPTLCYHFLDLSDSTLIDTSACNTLDVGPLVPSITDANTGAAAYVYRCGTGTAGSAASAGQCTKMLVDTDGDGVPDDVPMDGVTVGKIGQQYQTATWLYVHPTALTSSRISRLMITCH